MLSRIFLLIFVCLCSASSAQTKVQMDTAKVGMRNFNAGELEKHKAADDFQYDRYKEPPRSLWDRFWTWFWFKVSQLLNTKGGRTTLWTIFIIVGVIVITYFVIKVMGMNKNGLFGRSSSQTLDYTISSDNIHGISFDDAINEAIAASNFRLAVRLLYLQSLKKLSDANYITWQINKTNTDYLSETRDKKWHPLFSTLTYNFEYTWYGETDIDRAHFQHVQQQFNQFNNQL